MYTVGKRLSDGGPQIGLRGASARIGILIVALLLLLSFGSNQLLLVANGQLDETALDEGVGDPRQLPDRFKFLSVKFFVHRNHAYKTDLNYVPLNCVWPSVRSPRYPHAPILLQRPSRRRCRVMVEPVPPDTPCRELSGNPPPLGQPIEIARRMGPGSGTGAPGAKFQNDRVER